MKDIDINIINSCISGKRDAQKQLYLLLLPYLRAVVNRYLKDTSYSKDVLQESFVKIFRNIDTYDYLKAPIKSWAAKIVIRNSLNYNKRIIGISNEEFVIEKHQTVELSKIDQLTDQDILVYFKKMPQQYFEVFNLFVIDGYSHAEISEILNINQSLSRKRLSRARAWVKKTFIEEPNWSSNPISHAQ